MSQRNVDVLRRSFEAWNRNDWDALMACHGPDVVVVAPAEWPEAEMAAGRDALRRQWEQAKAAWEEERVEVDELRDLGDTVLALYRWIARGRSSHVEVEHRVATLNTLRAGRIVRVEYFLDQSKAITAAERRE